MTLPNFRLVEASVHYGVSRYPLNGVDPRFEIITGAADLTPAALADEAHRLTGYLREFEVRHYDRREYALEGRPAPLVIAEQVLAQADGFTFRWERAS
jgi:hypothetical protein